AIMVALQVPGPDEAGHALLLLALEDPRRIGRVDAEATHGVTPLLRLVGDRAALVIVRRGDPSAGIDAVTRWLAALRRALTDDPSEEASVTAIRRALDDTDAYVRVAVGPDDTREALSRWGPVTPLTRAGDLCGTRAGSGSTDAAMRPKRLAGTLSER
ncbi:MAG: hypothetical protein ACI9MR_003944, partial [Myxococcota bacterium]